MLFTSDDLKVIAELIDQERCQPPARAHLAHGDFDISPVFCADGRYTGLIDFGEIRGADPLYDLGHFFLHDQETHPAALLPALLRGYQQGHPLLPGHQDCIRRSAVLLGLRQLCRWLGMSGRQQLTAHRAQRISELIAQR